MTTLLRIATRKSPLALWQAEHVAACLQAHWPDVRTELVRIETRGDKILDVPLAKVGGKGLFTKEIDMALARGDADLAVHSMKDVPTELPPGMLLAALPEREDPFDAVATVTGGGLDSLPDGARIGTSSLRRIAQIKARYPHLNCVSIRGNIQTRLSRLGDTVDAVVLAAAGVRRMGLADKMHTFFDPNDMLPAVAQGTLGIQIRADDTDTARRVAPLDHADTRIRTTAERAFLARLEGGCQVPIAAYATLDGETVTLTGLVAEEDGSVILRQQDSAAYGQAQTLGQRLADRLLAAGARDILQRLYGNQEPS